MKKHHKKASKKAAYMYVSLRDDLRATFPRQPGTLLPPATAVQWVAQARHCLASPYGPLDLDERLAVHSHSAPAADLRGSAPW